MSGEVELAGAAGGLDAAHKAPPAIRNDAKIKRFRILVTSLSLGFSTFNDVKKVLQLKTG
jgi:hypothetical protein